MKEISVDRNGLLDDFGHWGVANNYAQFFLGKCRLVENRVELQPLMFNDTMHLTNPHQWLAANAAFWCRAYREAESKSDQIEALASIRTIFYISGALGLGVVTWNINNWWVKTIEIHGLVQINYSCASARTTQQLH
ncbi:hypothetical protein [Yersinia massiliensis]|uniref:hypothetical protein n=1 Tax=Yersinia massiliensis TaxID=419257 RepID=UPI0011A379A5|nr:hypothetical protein [Yersinia massiliensis]